MSSEPQRGRSPSPARVLESAVRVGKHACESVEDDRPESCLADEERQKAVEKLLLRPGEAQETLPAEFLARFVASIERNKPIRFRDLAAHWYEDGLDRQLIWNVLQDDPSPLSVATEPHLNSPGTD
jgi:uncharacterized protein with HEPN domain